MRKFFSTLVLAGAICGSFACSANAAAVTGFDTQYQAVVSSCTLPDGTVKACEVAINGYSSVLVGAVDLTVANQSFTELRSEVFAANAADKAFQKQIDDLFELLLPDSGAINVPVGVPAASPN